MLKKKKKSIHYFSLYVDLVSLHIHTQQRPERERENTTAAHSDCTRKQQQQQQRS